MVKLSKLEKAKQLETRFNSRDYEGKLTTLEPYIKFVRMAESSKGLGTSKHLLLASHVALLGVIKGEKAGAPLFSPDFEKLCEGIAQFLQPHLDEGAKELFKNWIMSSLITMVGSFYLSIEAARPKEDEYPVEMGLYSELLLRLMLKTESPSIFIESFVDAIGIVPKENGVKAIEAFGLLFILAALSNGEINEELFRAAKERIQKGLESIDLWVDHPEAKRFVKLALIALDKQQHEMITKGIKDLLKAFSINLEHLKEDLHAIRRLFTNLKSHFAIKRKGKEAVITFTG